MSETLPPRSSTLEELVVLVVRPIETVYCAVLVTGSVKLYHKVEVGLMPMMP